MGDCIFCKIVQGELPSEMVFEDDDFIVIRDVAPKVDGHLLVISKRHFEKFVDMDDGLEARMLGVVRDAVRREEIVDFNLVLNNGRIAGQVVDHVHLHILPREEGDGFVGLV
jgi:histidine triad (HIT) family protein